MLKTIEHQNMIIDMLEKAGVNGLNSRVLINHVTPRWSARKRELVLQGFIFREKRERISGSNLIRIWLEYNPRNGKKLPSTKPIRYEFNNETGVCVAIYE